MPESSYRQSSVGPGRRVDEIHAHPQRRTNKWLPWLLLGAFALFISGWALLRTRHVERARTMDETTRSAPPTDTTPRTEPRGMERTAPDTTTR